MFEACIWFIGSRNMIMDAHYVRTRSSGCIGHQSSAHTGAPGLKTWDLLPGMNSAESGVCYVCDRMPHDTTILPIFRVSNMFYTDIDPLLNVAVADNLVDNDTDGIRGDVVYDASATEMRGTHPD